MSNRKPTSKAVRTAQCIIVSLVFLCSSFGVCFEPNDPIYQIAKGLTLFFALSFLVTLFWTDPKDF